MTSTDVAVEADVAYIDAGKTLRQAGHLMRDLGVGALGVRGEDGKIQGTISRDMVVRRIAAGGDPGTVTVEEVASRRRPALPAPASARRLRPGPGPRQFTRELRTRRFVVYAAWLAAAWLDILTSGPANQPLDDAPDLPEASPPTGAVRAKRALRSAPVVLVRGIRMPACAETGASVIEHGLRMLPVRSGGDASDLL